ncbi:hypothetical protein [Nocardioides cavernaquae]|jgi:hypothetical protein|uniref:hypothetical protein n=1 Tax=Nocardioides cavernaquae TaxID=2321396 RepID=UPI0016032B6A|nr:hypothetical protein [Nocardioides cavernaquae]
MHAWAVLTGWEIAIAVLILVAFIVSIFISLSVKNRDLGDQDLEHWDHEHGDADAR